MNDQTYTEKQKRKYSILVAEDEENTLRATVRSLQLAGYDAEGVPNGLAAIQKLGKKEFDLILLDVRMPEMDGIDLMRRLEKTGRSIPIIILTAYATLESAITSVKAGAVDYLIKPQHIQEILAAIEKALSKKELQNENHILGQMMLETLTILKAQNPNNHNDDIKGSAATHQTGRLILQVNEQRVILKDKESGSEKIVGLTSQQASILQYLINAGGKVCSCGQIAREALNYPQITGLEAKNLVRPHILRLREKIENDLCHPTLIVTVRGRGYLFQA
jgi:two-component system KDP operon response regulator KdpE